MTYRDDLPPEEVRAYDLARLKNPGVWPEIKEALEFISDLDPERKKKSKKDLNALLGPRIERR